MIRAARRMRTLAGLITTCAAAVVGTSAIADEWFDLNGQALATFEFEGSELPATVDELKQRFPAAQLNTQAELRGEGLESYQVDGLPAVDSARFFFCDGRLYQFEARYELPRIEKLGGMRFVLQKLVDTWGPVDHAGESRWTWQRPMYARRADFYAWPDGARLTITDTSLLPIINRRIRDAEQKSPMNLGFETR